MKGKKAKNLKNISFFVLKVFESIFSDFLDKNENQEIQIFRGKPSFLKKIKYVYARWRTCYGVTVSFHTRNWNTLAHLCTRKLLADTKWLLKNVAEPAMLGNWNKIPHYWSNKFEFKLILSPHISSYFWYKIANLTKWLNFPVGWISTKICYSWKLQMR